LNKRAVDRAHSGAKRLLALLEAFKPAAPKFQPAARLPQLDVCLPLHVIAAVPIG